MLLYLSGGTLLFDKADIELHAENILIVDGGALQVGTEEEPFQHQATIMMHGHLRSQELPLFGAKTLAVRNGTLDLHGESGYQSMDKFEPFQLTQYYLEYN